MADTTDRIIAAEWRMFDKVQGRNGRAPCQDDLRTFVIMRFCQLFPWDDAMRVSYEKDLLEAEAMERNLVTEKYAWMMERSAPAEFAAIVHLLPPISQEHRSLVEEIVRIVVEWQVVAAEHYPKLLRQGRVINSHHDAPGIVSFETYLRGELYTYSLNTLRAYRRRVEELLTLRKNMSLIILEQTVKQYGYHTLEEAEAAQQEVATRQAGCLRHPVAGLRKS